MSTDYPAPYDKTPWRFQPFDDRPGQDSGDVVNADGVSLTSGLPEGIPGKPGRLWANSARLLRAAQAVIRAAVAESRGK
jgi:hypothetical protein